MKTKFRIGVSPDFYVEYAGKTLTFLEDKLAGRQDVECGPMPPQPGKIATPEALNQFDGLFSLALKITAESLRGVDRLAIVARAGVGYDMIDVEALTRADIALAITPNAVRRPVAEAILTFMFALSKNLLLQDRLVRQGGWRSDLRVLGRDMPGRVLGSVGCGNIAREMFRLARPLGFARLLACDPYVKPEQAKEFGVELVDMDTVFRESDFVAVNTWLNAETRGLIGERHFRLMKPTAFFINTARGAIVQQDALVRALQERWIAGAGLDVYAVEPPPKDHPLFALDNVIVAPHALAWTEEMLRDNGLEACDNLLTVARGEPPPGLVNREVLAHPGFQKKLARYKSGP